MNVEELLMRLRYGRYLAVTEELFGESVSRIELVVRLRCWCFPE